MCPKGDRVTLSYTFPLTVDVWSLAFSSDSKTLATGSHNGKINLFSVDEGKKKSALDTRGKFIMSIAYVSVLLNSPSDTLSGHSCVV